MKRFLSVALVLAFVAFISVPVSASEAFVFERWEPIQLFDDSYDFVLGENTSMYGYSGVIPSGTYEFSFVSYGIGTLYGDAPVEIYVNDFVDSDYEGYIPTYLSVTLVDGMDPFVFKGFVVSDGSFSLLIISEPVNLPSGFSLPDTFKLVPVSVNFLSSVVDSGMLNGALNQVVALLPVVLGVLIGYIALRKAIAFLQDRLSGA